MPILRLRLNSTFKSNFHTNSKMFSIINFEPRVAKNIAIKITEKKTNINSIIDDKIISFLENPKILKTKF